MKRSRESLSPFDGAQEASRRRVDPSTSRVQEPRAAGKVDSFIVKNILAMANELNLKDKLESLPLEEKVAFVKNHAADKTFMIIAVRHDRTLLRYANKVLIEDPDLLKIALQAVDPIVQNLPIELKEFKQQESSTGDKPWQNQEEDRDTRLKFARELCYFLIRARPFAPMDWISCFSNSVPKIEIKMYLAASSKADYADTATIRVRLAHFYKTLRSASAQQSEQQAQQQQQQHPIEDSAVVNPVSSCAQIVPPVQPLREAPSAALQR